MKTEPIRTAAPAQATPAQATDVTFRHPSSRDSAEVWRLARDTSVLDLNPPYAYALCLESFSGTSAVAYRGGDLAGFVLGFSPPERSDALFVWQIGVSAERRGEGVAIGMLSWLVRRNEWVAFVEATVTPANEASAGLFRAFARRHSAPHTIKASHFDAALFPPEAGAHAAEDLHRIGPIAR